MATLLIFVLIAGAVKIYTLPVEWMPAPALAAMKHLFLTNTTKAWFRNEKTIWYINYYFSLPDISYIVFKSSGNKSQSITYEH